MRNARYRRARNLRLRDADGIREFVNDVGLCLLFPVQGLEMPNVYQAVAGFAKQTTPQHDDPTISLTWNTKDRALDQRWWYYGKLIKAKATLASFEVLPQLYALSENYGEPDDYLHEYEAGTLSADAKNIYAAVLKHGAMHAIDIKRKVGLYGDEHKGKFDKALTELQVGLKVLPVGVAEAGAWRYAFIYELLWRWLPELPAQARAIGRGEARAALLARHLRNVIFATPKEIGRVFGWKPAEVEKAITAAVASGAAATGRLVKGVDAEVVVRITAHHACVKIARVGPNSSDG